ncbi:MULTISPECIES: sugar ABC transporter substrate-binding protein [Microbacterium]|uniref:sugar ABC transporter substrate-binding protein n=1 Tax=Microbacterium TaxID=33882 RepID=UPI001656C9B4|nr:MULTISPECIES: maltose ABC transporter substrate-binding protein [Microbacterium]MCZ0709294.1 maltose ABC transporter substrate-binding protein [Microbacterium paraoxydans]MDH5132095.1 maltose ABC transporter substrate-binding protein [Microbacterium sp. RD10]MDH5135958.1 maltose ABC transporter substrate-binding protein [Microbacterium sp. RD11]MDH5143844.1 maltose ABC transporter substrate-binding protein [Microbacterium sp. RD12]MDH5153200.1 maltose ABC transporter substrate-binding prote
MKVNKRGMVAAGAIAIVSALTLAGCSTGSGGDDSSSGGDSGGTLTVWVDAERVDALQGAADAYQEKTGVTVKLVGKSVDDMKDDFIQQVPTGKGPDVVMGAHDWLGELSTNGVVAPIELGDSSEDYLPVALQAATYEGTVYMLPYAVENIAVLRNADLVPEPATSFDDMVSKGTFVVEQGAEGNPYHLYPFQTAFDAPVFGTDDSGSYDPTDLQLGSEGGFAFADWLGAQGAAGTLNTDIDGEIAKQQFLDGTAAFWLTGPWNVGAATDAGINVEIDPIPSPTGETASPFAGVKGFFVSAESKNKVAANDFLVNYLGTEDVQLELFTAGNVLPALTAAADTAASDPIIAGFQAVGADAVPMPAIPAMGAVWQFWGVAEAAIINGEDPQATWQKLVDDVTAAIE